MHGIRSTAPPQSRYGRYAMTQVIALSLSIAVLGGIWAFLALGPLSGFVLVWAGFVGWGCFFHSGANNNALVKTIVGNAYGALVAWVALLIIVNVPVPGLGAVWSAIVGGVTVFFLVIVASIDLLSVVPANVYGYAALVAYSLHQPSAAPATGPLQNLVSPSFMSYGIAKVRAISRADGHGRDGRCQPPPYRSRRALLTHRAPPSGFGVEAVTG